MYTKFKECLLKPSRIGKYVDDKLSKTVLYFLLLLLLYILPSMISLVNVTKMPSTISRKVVDSFATSEVIDYKLEQIEEKTVLVKTKEDANYQYVKIDDALAGYNMLIFFNLDGEFNINNYKLPTDLNNTSAILVVFEKENLSFTIGTIKTKVTSGDIMQVASENINYISYSYDEIGLKEINFSRARNNKVEFLNYLDNSYVSVYKKHLGKILLITIPYEIIISIISLLLEVVILALFLKLFYGKMGIKYGTLCKICMLAYTPRVVFLLLSVFWSSVLMYYVGQLLTIIYILIAVRYYVIRNIGITISKVITNDDNRGDENNEL